jgi:hypothetical protein
MITQRTGHGAPQVSTGKEVISRAARLLPEWRQVLAVVAHPDDETFGLGAIADSFAAGGTSVHVPSWVSPPSPCSITPMAI